MNWKFRILSAVGTGFLYAFLLWVLNQFSEEKFFSVEFIIIQSILFGIIYEIGFPYINDKLAGKFSFNLIKIMKPELQENEQIEIEGSANLFRGIESVGGKIFLTNKKIIFNSHKLNIQTGTTYIDYEDIREITKRKTAKLIDNGIRIITNEGKQYDFVVNERNLWIEKLNEKIK